jgi:hypothetical protein
MLMTNITYYGNSADGQIKRVETVRGGSYTLIRGYLVFSITSPPFTLEQIDSVALRIVVSDVVGSTTYRLRSTKAGSGDEWFNMIEGDPITLTLTEGDPDFSRVQENLESDVGIGSTGTYNFTVDKNNLNLSGYTYFRIVSKYENSVDNQGSITFASQNNATTANRPQLIVTYTIPAAGGPEKHVCVFF